MKNLDVARSFDMMADVLEMEDDNPLRVRAYRRAAENLRSRSEDVATLAREDRLTEVPGIGEDLAGKIAEYLRKGRVKEIAAARRGVPDGVLAMMSVPGIGPKTARVLYEDEGISTLDHVEKLARAGRLRGRHGFQARSEQNILKGIALPRAGQERMPFGRELVRALQAVPGVNEAALVYFAGSKQHNLRIREMGVKRGLKISEQRGLPRGHG